MKRPRFIKCACGKRRKVGSRGMVPTVCLKCANAARVLSVYRWRERNREAYNAYMRDYQRAVRAAAR